jgi:1-acyl-sn-glycerol-3-phosphate acyltransferase
VKGLYRFSWEILRFVARLLFGFRAEVIGRAYPERGGCIFASNHVSYADPIVAGLGIRRELHFLAKVELFSIPLLSWWIRHHNAVPVRRGGVERRTLQTIGELLREGGALLLFPEGTRSLDGNIARPFPGVGMIASRSEVPIYPVYVRGTRGIGRSLLRRGRMTTYIGEPVDPAAFAGMERKERYRRIADAVADGMREMSERYG